MILTPAMEEVIRVREIRKSMEVSGHYFTPSCSPTDGDDSETPNGGRLAFSPASGSNVRRVVNPIDVDLTSDSSPSTEEEEPLRRKTRASNSARVQRHRPSVVLNSTASSVESATSPCDISAIPEGVHRRVIQKRNVIFLFTIRFHIYLSHLIAQANIKSFPSRQPPLKHHRACSSGRR
jgi:hypothetical protein